MWSPKFCGGSGAARHRARSSASDPASRSGLDEQPSLRNPRQGRPLGLPFPDWPDDGPLDARKARLADALERAGTKTLRYLYDFGDSWEHTIKIERQADPEPNVVYPRLVEAAGRCPPEDVGGPWGYGDLIEALDDPKHERHDELREWVGADFDPRRLDAEALKAEVAALAKRWSRKSAAKKPKGT